ncbi:GNAT family N-acetyltransferase [Lysinibacillus sphaericus]|uniref:GNAT family N-acetyltransferase n=1 Tax=Lysinibacillus sphaericus TaxID=1421 RepID=UPI00163B86FA|nr:GNAT family N-acetyltransferase [Lysinibacillus sp. SDF0037]
MEIRLAKIDDFAQVVYILNEVTLNLQQKGIQQWEFPWDDNKIINQLKNDYLYVLLVEEEMIGTFCIYDIDNINEFSLDEKGKYLSQIAILPKFQGKNIGSAITEFACFFVKELDKTLYLDCWAGNEKLKQFYSRNGLKYIGDFPEENYFVSIFKYS